MVCKLPLKSQYEKYLQPFKNGKKKGGLLVVSNIKTFLCLKLKYRPDTEKKTQPAISNNCCDKRDKIIIIIVIIVIII